MKKCLAGISVIVLVISLLLTACNITPGAKANVSAPASETKAAIESTVTPSSDAMSSDSPSEPTGIDRTVDLSTLDPFEPPAEETPPGGGVALLEFGTIYYDAGDLSEDAKDIVVGEVLATYYTDVDANPIIYYDFKISEVLRGDLGVEDTITVGHFGGYTRGSAKDDLILDSGSGVPFPAVGDQYVLFMQGSDYWQFPTGVYALCGGFMGRYFVDGESVKRYTPYDSPYFYIKNGEYFDANNPIPNDPKTLPELRTVVSETPLVDK